MPARAALLCILISGLSNATAANYPKRQAGLWEIQSSASRDAGLRPVNQCVGAKTDSARNHLDRLTGKRGFCQLKPFVRRDGIWIAESLCRYRRNRVITRKIATGDFQNAYRIDTIVRTRQKKRSRTLVKDVLTARYLGPCKPGQRPDDLIAPGMGTLNMSDGEFKAEKRRK